MSQVQFPPRIDLESRMWVQFVDWGGDTRRTHEEWGRKLEGEGPNKEAISEPVISMGSYGLSKIH